MLSRRHLLHEGRLVPAAIVYAHDRHLEELSRTCPEALPVAHVAGDPCVDRIITGRTGRTAYRRALGLQDGQRLVVVTSTWGPASTFGRLDSLLPQGPHEVRQTPAGGVPAEPGREPYGAHQPVAVAVQPAQGLL